MHERSFDRQICSMHFVFCSIGNRFLGRILSPLPRIFVPNLPLSFFSITSLLMYIDVYIAHYYKDVRICANRAKLAAIRVCFVEWILDAVSAIIHELGWVAEMFFIIRAFLPFFGKGICRAHDKLYALLFNTANRVVWDIAVFGEKITFMNKKRVFIDLCDMPQFLVVGRIDLHMCMNVVLAPIGHESVPRFRCKYFCFSYIYTS